MSLEKKISGALSGIGDYLTGRVGDMNSYLKDKRLKKHFEGLKEEERDKRTSLLERYVQESTDKYKTELQGFARKTATRGTMLTAIANDLYSLVSKAPLSNFSAISYVLFGAKTLAEIPAVYRYMKKSHDWYGLATWGLMKPINYVLPVIGPAIESGLFEYIVKKRVMKEAENKFLHAIGEENQKVLIKKSIKNRIGDIIDKKTIEVPGDMIPTYA